MSGGKNAYLMKQARAKNTLMHQTELLTKQYMVDTLQITLHQKFGWGFDRIMRLMDEWDATRDEYRPSLNPKDPECDVCQDHIDRVLTQIIRGKMDLIPWEERYPDLKTVKYK